MAAILAQKLDWPPKSWVTWTGKVVTSRRVGAVEKKGARESSGDTIRNSGKFGGHNTQSGSAAEWL